MFCLQWSSALCWGYFSSLCSSQVSCCYLLRQPPSAPLSQVHHYWDVECRKNVAAGSSDCTVRRETSLSVSTADPNHFKYQYVTLPKGTQPVTSTLVLCELKDCCSVFPTKAFLWKTLKFSNFQACFEIQHTSHHQWTGRIVRLRGIKPQNASFWYVCQCFS